MHNTHTNTHRDSNIFIHTDIIKALLLKRFILCYPLNPILRLKAITNKNPQSTEKKRNNKRKKYARWANVQTLAVLLLLLLFFFLHCQQAFVADSCVSFCNTPFQFNRFYFFYFPPFPYPCKGGGVSAKVLRYWSLKLCSQ